VCPKDISAHEARLEHLVELQAGLNPLDFASKCDVGASGSDSMPGSGAAGGLGYGLMVFAGAKLAPGFDIVANALNLDQKLAWADIVITGEGQLDGSSLAGKAPVALARCARAMRKRVIALCGRWEKTARPQLEEIFHQIIAISPPDLPVHVAMKQAAALLRTAAKTLRF
jgi:glycerate kinase